jgi:hypothetical protein
MFDGVAGDFRRKGAPLMKATAEDSFLQGTEDSADAAAVHWMLTGGGVVCGMRHHDGWVGVKHGDMLLAVMCAAAHDVWVGVKHGNMLLAVQRAGQVLDGLHAWLWLFCIVSARRS